VQLGYGVAQVIKFVDLLKTFMEVPQPTLQQTYHTPFTTSQQLLWMPTIHGLFLHQEQLVWSQSTQP
jgi:hypothetical protein